MPREPLRKTVTDRSEDTMSNRYDDIINRSRPVSANHKPMPLEARAAQFAPFAALNGHNDAIIETARQTDGRIELSADEQKRLSVKLNRLLVTPRGVATFTIFTPDSLKAGGRYDRVKGTIAKLDEIGNTIILDNGTHLPLNHIIDISID